MPQLDVPAMTKPILHNYDMHVNNFIRFLRDKLQIYLVYDGPKEIRQHILQKTVYACSVYCNPKKTLRNVFPIMIGSRLDLVIRHKGLKKFREPFDLSDSSAGVPFQELDIATGFFIIGGLVRHLPYFYTNDPTNTHVIQRKIVRVYSYNAQDRGKELNYYVADNKKKKYGDVVVVHNDGSETDDDPRFFDHCPYPVHLTAYMNQLYRDDHFDIDHLGNKMVVSPGHMFTKLFIKYLYGPLREQDWKLVKSRTALICNSIENGYLLHVLSRKTVYFKEGKSAGKMTNEPQESHREIGTNGKVFMEKNVGCYREILTQTYPLNPYLLYVIVRQMSKKVNNSSVESFHPSYLYFLCILGVFETKNVGRTTMMVRDTIVSTCDDLDPVYHDEPDKKFWDALNLEPKADSPYYVVVNEACIPVSKKSFNDVDLLKLKRMFETVECFERGKFIVIRFKTGIIMKKLPEIQIWVSPYDEMYWMRRIFGTESKFHFFYYTTSYFVDLNPFFQHTAFPKVILGFNAEKNAVLATDPKYTCYFMDTMSAYFRNPTPDHKILIRPVDDGVSKHFVLMMPQPVVTYMSFKGCTQEDCIVKRKNFRSFDFCRFYTVRMKITTDPTTWTVFYPVSGDEDPESDLLGTLISGKPLEVEPFSIHTNLKKMSPCEYRIHFSKVPFRVVQYFISGDKLSVSVEQKHVSNTGDKLCSLHGQKGVMRVMDEMPKLDDGVEPDIIVNPYCMFRLTVGQIIEAVELGGGKDAAVVRNSSGVLIEGARAFYGRTFYFVVVYLAAEHLYAAAGCTLDRVTNQPLKGRSRGGGMRIGNMEVNALRANGTAFILLEKFFEHADLIHLTPTVAIPKSVNVVVEDAKCYKFLIEFECSPSIQLIEYDEEENRKRKYRITSR